MRINFFSSTNEISAEIGRRLKAVRIDLSMTQEQLAEKTNLSMRTISNLETGKDVSFSTVIEVLRALELLHGINQLVPEQEIRPRQLAAMKKSRRRVRNKQVPVKANPTWTWGDEE